MTASDANGRWRRPGMLLLRAAGLSLAFCLLLAAARAADPAKPPAAAASYWLPLRGEATDLVVGAKGDAYALDSAGHVWRLAAGQARPGASWARQPGEFRKLRATPDGSFWGLTDSNELYRLSGSVWRRVDRDVRDVSATPDGLAWILAEDGSLRAWPGRDAFLPAPPASVRDARSLVDDEHGLPWLQAADGSFWRFNGTAWEQAAAAAEGLREIAIGADGSTFGIGADGDVVRRDSASGRWLPYRDRQGAAAAASRHVAVGADGLPWLIARDGEVLAERPVQAEVDAAPPPAVFTRLLQWQPMSGGKARELDVGTDGTVYSVAPDGTPWRWRDASVWSVLPGRVASIVAGDAGRAWGLDAHGSIRQLDNGFWHDLPGQAARIAAGPKNRLLAVLANGDLSAWDANANSWQRLLRAPTGIAWLAVGQDGEPWLVDRAGTVQVLESGGWHDLPGIRAATVDVGPDGTVYATTRDGDIYWLDRGEAQWKPATGKASQIAVGPDGAPWAIAPDGQVLASDRFVERHEAEEAAKREQEIIATPPVLTIVAGPLPSLDRPLQYQRLPASVQDVGIGADGSVYAVGSDGALLCLSNADRRFLPVSMGKLLRITVAADGTPWTLGSDGIVSYHERSGWTLVPEFTGKDIAVGADGKVWAAGTDGQSYLYAKPQQRFAPVPVVRSDAAFKADRVAGGRDGALWVVGDNHQLYRCDKGDCRLRLAGALDVAAAPDGTVFALDLLGGVRRYDERGQMFEPKNGAGVAIAVGPQGLPWLVTMDGQLDYAGLFQPNSRTINTAQCAAGFAGAPVPVQQAPANLDANDDVATVAAGDSVPILGNDLFNGRTPTTDDALSLTFDSNSPALRLEGDVVRIAEDVLPGTLLRGGYKLCPEGSFSACASAKVIVTVAAPVATTAPAAPTGISAITGDGQALVSFSPPASDGGSPITGYTVTSSPGGLTASGTASPIVVSGLANGTAYAFAVTATNAVGTGPASTPSNSVTPQPATAVPGAPTGVSATAGDAQATVGFAAPASDGGSPVTGYTVTSSPGGFSASGATSPLVVTGLSNGTAYTFTVTAANAVGTGPASALSNSVTPQSATTMPGAPTGVSATAGDAQATVGFAAPASDGGSPITSYSVTSSPGGLTASGASSPLTVAGLSNGLAYTFTVTATNAVGTGPASTPSNSVTPQPATTVPGAPTGVSAAAGDTQATVGFAAPASDGGSPITSYSVTSSPGGLTGSGTASPIVVSSLSNGTAYTFTVTAANAVGTGPASAPSNSVTPQPATTVPGAPTGVSAIAGDAQATVGFAAPASDGGSPVTSYTVTSAPGGLTGSGTASPIVVSSLSNGTAYTFTVTAANAVGTGPASAPSNSVTPQPAATAPGAPTGVGATAGDAQATVGFAAPASDGGSPITSYTVTSAPGGITASGTASPIIVTGLANGTAYTFTVTARNAIGIGPASASSNTATPAGLPGAPTGVNAFAGDGEAIATFTPPANDGGSPIAGYTVTSLPGGITASGTASSIVVSGLSNGTAYRFTVTATNAIGTGPASTPSNSVTPQPAATAPGAPTGVSAAAGDAQATIGFAAPADDGGSPITGYTATSAPGGIMASGTASPIIVTGLANGTAYTFAVTATNAVGTGPASAPSNSVTPAGVPDAPTSATAVAGDGQAMVSFAAPASDGGSPIAHYTVSDNFGDFMVDGASSPIVVTGLANGVAYTFTVTATNTVGTGPASAPSNSVTPLAAPGAPTAVSAVAGDAQATIGFTAPADDGGSPITGYTVTDNYGDFSVDGASSPIVVSGLVNGTAYTFTVTATNAVGTGPASAPSNSVTPVGTPGAPGNVIAHSLDRTTATIAFDPPADDGGSPVTGYTATSSPEGLTASGASSPLTISDLTYGDEYSFTVTATTAIGTSPASAPSNAITPGTPGKSTNVVATPGANPGELVVSFDPPFDLGSSGINWYTAECSAPPPLQSNSALGFSEGPITVDSLITGVVYTCTVSLENDVGGVSEPSAPSNPVTAP